MNNLWWMAGLLGVMALIGSLLARARRLEQRAAILLEERSLDPAYRARAAGSAWEW